MYVVKVISKKETFKFSVKAIFEKYSLKGESIVFIKEEFL